MPKKKPDLPDPEEQAAEERVRQMMDPEPIVPSAPEVSPVVAPSPKKSISINVRHHEDEPDSEITAAIVEANEQLKAVATAPELPAAKKTRKTRSKPLATGAEPEPPLEAAVPEATEVPATAAPEPAEIPVAEGLPTEVEPETQPLVDDTESPASEVEPEKSEEPEPEADSPDLPAIEPDESTDRAVEEIQTEESDQVLQADDREQEIVAAFTKPKPSIFRRAVKVFSNRTVRWAVIIIMLVSVAAAGTIPGSRYFVLNTAGVRSSASLIVLDESTQQPLKNVRVTVRGQSQLSDAEGKVRLDNLRLGPATLTIEKRAFASVTRQHTLGWGSNPLGDFRLKPVGTQYTFNITDFLSGKGISKVEASSGDANALSDDKGQLKLTTDDTSDKDMEVILRAEGYREEKLTIGSNDTQEKAVQLVVSRKHVFVSKRFGKLDVFKVDIDGKNEERLLAATGTERDDMVIVPHTTDDIAAVVSTRENKRNKDGFLLSTLTTLDLRTNAAKPIATSERVQPVEWIGSRLIYVAVAEGQSASSPKRHRLMSYDYKTEDTKELAASNSFNDVVVTSGKIYYSPSSAYQESGEVGLFRMNADGSNRETIISKEVWNIFRSSHDHLILALPQQWYDFRISDKAPVKLDGPPANPVTRLYADSPDGKRSLWVDNRDGKGVLLYYDTLSKRDATVRTQSGLKNPVRWLNNAALVFRIHTEQETADYALNLDGGEAKKIRDVTDTGGVDKWYYY